MATNSTELDINTIIKNEPQNNQDKYQSVIQNSHINQVQQLQLNRQTSLSGCGTSDAFYSFEGSHLTEHQGLQDRESVSKIVNKQQKEQIVNSNRKVEVNKQQTQLHKLHNEQDQQQKKLQQEALNKQQHQNQSQLPQYKPSDELIQACSQIVHQLLIKIQLQQIRRNLQQKLTPIYSQFCKMYEKLLSNIQICQSIDTYAQILIKYWDQQMFFQHFVQNRYLNVLMNKIREFKYAADVVKAVFGCLEFLIKGLGSYQNNGKSSKSNSSNNGNNSSNRQEQFIYLLVMINKEGFITENYKFSESEDWAYYAHFMKLLIRIINQADKAQQQIIRKSLLDQNQQNEQNVSQSITFSPQKPLNSLKSSLPLQSLSATNYQQIYSKYLTIFFNQRTPQFPLLLKLLYFYKWPDTILQTSVKLCLLQISNHPNRKLQKYLLNFPFVCFYLFYCTKICDNVEKCLIQGGKRTAIDKQSQKQQMLIEQIVSDIKFMQDYLKIQHEQPISQQQYQSQQNPQSQTNNSHINFKTGNIRQHLNIYINTFIYYLGRTFYQYFSKCSQNQQNINGFINGMLLLIKILKINTILKIKLAFQEMLHKYINCQFWEYLKMKKERLDQRYWMFGQCQATIKEHVLTILYNGQDDEQTILDNKQIQSDFKSNKSVYQSQAVQVVQLPSSQISPVSKSTLQQTSTSQKQKKSTMSSYSSMVFKAMRSYIPTSNYKWLADQMRKISEVIGVQVKLNQQIKHATAQTSSNSLYKSSCVYIVDKIQDNNIRGNNTLVLKSKTSLLSRFSSPIRINPLFTGIINIALKNSKHNNHNHNHVSSKTSSDSQSGSGKKIYQDNSQELTYYYLVLMCSIKDNSSNSNNNGISHSNNNSNKNNASSQEKINLQEITDLLKITKKCRSLMLVGMMYWYIKVLDYQLDQSSQDYIMPNQDKDGMTGKDKDKNGSNSKTNKDQDQVKEKQKQKDQDGTLAADLCENYRQSMGKLVYYILTEGWETFTKHIKEIKKVIWSNSNNQKIYDYQNCNRNAATQFSNDIFRDIECDIVYFIMLKHILGTRNTKQQQIQDIGSSPQDRDIISKQIKIPCRLTNSQGDQVYLIMDGQYIKFISADDILITKKPLSVASFNIYYDESSNDDMRQDQYQMANKPKSQIKPKIPQSNKNAVFELVDKGSGDCFTVYFQEIPIREYAAKEIKWRKKVIMEIEMALKTMRFDIQQ